MRLRRTLLIALFVLLAAAGLVYANRLLFLQYMVGWRTDILHPRGPNRPVPWLVGPRQAELPPEQRAPNIVLILADDLGYNDVSTHGGGYAAFGAGTPHIDSIARDGVNFDRGYAGAAICTVSRAALMTGRYPWRFGVEFSPMFDAMARVAPLLYDDPTRLRPILVEQDKAAASRTFNEMGMPGSETTIAELLKARGYHTVHIGKWHLGGTPENPEMRPNAQGFDESLYMESGLYLPQDSPDVVDARQAFDPVDRFMWPNMRFGVSYNNGEWFEPAKYLTDYFTDEALHVIRNNRNRPFFLYLAHWGVHTPLQAAKADYDALAGIPDHRRRVYAAMVRSVDRSVGRVLQALRDEGLEDNTIVIFTSDNGAPGYIGLPEVNQPFRGWKVTQFEGGLRVPTMAKWPGRIPAGSRYPAPMSNIDILPTVLAAAGGAAPTDRVVDGVNLLPYLATNAPPQPARALFWRDGPYRAVQHDGWKLIVSAKPPKQWLFDLNRDPTERNNLVAQRPEHVARLQALLSAHHADMPAPLWPSLLQLPVAIDKTLDQKEEAQDEYTYWFN